MNGSGACSYACCVACCNLSSKLASRPVLLLLATVTNPCRGIGNFQHTCTYGMQLLQRSPCATEHLLLMRVAGYVVVHNDSSNCRYIPLYDRISDHQQGPVQSQLQRMQSRRWPVRRSSNSAIHSEDGSGSPAVTVAIRACCKMMVQPFRSIQAISLQ